jgi:uncharacterized membrane protein (UPF0127 family)
MKRLSQFKLIILCAFLFLTGFSCHEGLKSDLPVVQLKLGNKIIEVEVANKVFTRETGLMFRKEMGTDNGMLFVFAKATPQSFWMKNTVIPLSIAFIDEKGVILNTLEMPPETEKSFLSKGPAKYALEMNTGWFDGNRVKAGDVVEGVLSAPKADE